MINTLYYCVTEKTIQFLRFYPDGVVIGVPVSSGVLSEIISNLSWFTIEQYNPLWSKGHYQYDGNKIKFELKSSSGVVVYNGHFSSDGTLILDSYSQINGHRSTSRYTKHSSQSNVRINSSNVMIDTPSISAPDVLPKKETTVKEPVNFTSKSSSSFANKFYTFILVAILFTGCFTCASRHRVGCHCWDGSNSYATGRGACSHHGGVMYWKYEYWWDK